MRYLRQILLFASFFFAISANAQGWRNPLTLGNQEWMGIGDPYILKYRGVYYLYSSARYNVHCWTSTDLINWTDATIVCTDEVADNAYAPEVKYWNGTFYMCTSPAGHGHYILTSDSPLGPFTHVTENMGYDIDGSFFVDDDGSWYLYRASNDGILGSKMPSQTSFGTNVNLGARMNNQWTEGPCVFKRNDIYYLIYTGNHVLTNGYRIDYATSTEGPLAQFTPQQEQNPILIDTESSAHFGLGHGSAFIGPDLDSYYFTYHNLNRYENGSTNRNYNFDRIGWNGDKLMMYGPTTWTQDAPAIADNDYFNREEIGSNWTMSEGGEWAIVDNDHLSQTDNTAEYIAVLSPYSFDNYTAEFTVKAQDTEKTGTAGAVFSYVDAQNYSKAVINAQTKRLEISTVTNGEAGAKTRCMMPTGFNPRCWHSIRIEKDGEKARFFVDEMKVAELDVAAKGGSVGYMTYKCKADFSYIAISKSVGGRGLLDVNLPVPGILAASHNVDQSSRVEAQDFDLGWGKAKVMSVPSGEWLAYHISVPNSTCYNIGIRYKANEESRIRLVQNGKVVAERVMPSTNGEWMVETISGVELSFTKHDLRVEVAEGDITLYEYNIRRGLKKTVVLSDDFENGISNDWQYKEGNWTSVDGQAQISGCGKLLLGNYNQGCVADYTVECDITYTEGMNAGLLFRTTNPSTGGANDSPSLGSDFVQGYFFTLATTGSVLGKHNYGWKTIATGTGEHVVGQKYHLKVECIGSTFNCYVDGELAITYTDPLPFIQGRAGIRSHSCTALIDNFSFTPLYTETDIESPAVVSSADEATAIYNLSGQRLTSLQRGVNIVNGKKLLVK